MRLNDGLVTSFNYDDKEYTINLAFDVVLDVFDVLGDKDFRDYEKAEICLAMLLCEDIRGQEAIYLWNYIYESFINFEEKQPIEYDLKGNPMPVPDEDEEEEQHMDIEQDAEYIYTSFKQAYNMDLYEERGKLHWHQFKALLAGLPSDTIMQRVVQIRAWKPSKHDSQQQKENMKKLQQIYALREEGLES